MENFIDDVRSIDKYKSDKNWEIYRKQRNLVTTIKRDSIKTYFYERTAGGKIH
jgi:glucan phosphoethanolaminetransferase (alkaline phosphatase superfamily)